MRENGAIEVQIISSGTPEVHTIIEDDLNRFLDEGGDGSFIIQ